MTNKEKSMIINYMGKSVLYNNQSCNAWTHPYLYNGQGDENLSSSGCGIFSLCHAVEWMCGIRLIPEEMANFSVGNGGRGDDGTDRPMLLHALMESGMAQKMGFCYHEDGLRNDLDALFNHLYENKGTALCNLRPGHIVALLGARIVSGEKQLLAMDSVAESARDSVRDYVREVIHASKTQKEIVNRQGLSVGESTQYAMFYVTADLPRDFNLLHKI